MQPVGPAGWPGIDPGSSPIDTSSATFTPIDISSPGSAVYDFVGQPFSPGYQGNFDGSFGYPGGFGGDFSFGFDEPVVLDLDGNGIGITQLSSSNQFFDMAGDGYQHRTAWAAAGDGVLVFDSQGDGVIDQRNEVVFTEWDPTATSDMQALRTVFDTDHDGKLDAGDARFFSFKIWVTNADGTRTLKTLAQLGIVSIGLDEDKTRIVLPDGSSIDGETQFTRTNGTTGTAAAVTLAYEANGTALQSTTTRNADGSTTITSRQLGQDGQLVGETVSKTLAGGLTTTITFDRDGNGVIDQRQSSVTGVNADLAPSLPYTTLGGRSATLTCNRRTEAPSPLTRPKRGTYRRLSYLTGSQRSRRMRDWQGSSDRWSPCYPAWGLINALSLQARRGAALK